MTARLAACEACRKAKLACDHKRPACTRCSTNNNAAICIYRASPFKRKRTENSPPSTQQTLIQPPLPQSSPSFAQRRPNRYPNPGFLGSSSHVAIFNHISSEDNDESDANFSITASMEPQAGGENPLLLQGADILRQLFNTFSLSAMKDFVLLWLAMGANLALAEPLTKQLTENIDHLFTGFVNEEKWHLAYAQRLLHNSNQPLEIGESCDIHAFSAQFLDQNFRWESFGIVLCAISRATTDISFFPSLYTTEKDRIALRDLSAKLSSLALDIALSLDCLNDLQIFLQYENFILHSHVHGDHSYSSWTKLGNVISSMSAHGYHEDVEKTKPPLPRFLAEIRKTAFATIYSADKNVAIFLGRPPRMSKRFCYFQLPLTPTGSGQSPDASGNRKDIAKWDLNTSFGYRAELRWSALCASLKEDILEMLRDKHRGIHSQRAIIIENEAYAHWNALPPFFRLECSLRECYQNPFERDFLAGVRLNHLHVLFLLRLLQLGTPAEPDIPMIEISEQMLGLVVELILLRDQLVNSGTSLVWKVAHYGLPAAGIILLSMLRQVSIHGGKKTPWSRTLLNLGILAAQVQAGSIVKPYDPNYPLIHKATLAIDKFLDSIQREREETPFGETAYQMEADSDWAALFDQDLCDFETSFWENIADHPSFLP